MILLNYGDGTKYESMVVKMVSYENVVVTFTIVWIFPYTIES